MKLYLSLLPIAAAALCAFVLPSSPRTEDPPARAATLADLAWLEGGWTTRGGTVTTEEHWIAPKAKSMLGVGRAVRGDQTLFFEFLRLEERADGIYYVAHPNAGKSTEFNLASWSATEFRFENPAHDFPRTIRYTRRADGTLVAHLEGVEGGAPAAEDIVYSRIEK
jgi:hypothetical protein